MDAHAYLLSLGWQGTGYSLDSRSPLQHKGRRGLAYDSSQSHNTGRGLVKPLLISQKKNVFGVGKRTHEPAAGNEWWLKGFENALSNIGKKTGRDTTSRTASPESARVIANEYRGKHNGLYGYFVKGQQMEGTIREEAVQRFRGHKRKSDTLDVEAHFLPSSGTPLPSSPASQKKSELQGSVTADFQQISQFLGIRDKNRKKQDRPTKAEVAQEFEEMSHFFEARSGPNKKQRMKKSEKYAITLQVDERKITKEDPAEDRGRRKGEARDRSAFYTPGLTGTQKKEKRSKPRRAANATSNASSSKNINAWSSLTGSKQLAGDEASPASVQEALRRAERKRRREERRLAKLQADS